LEGIQWRNVRSLFHGFAASHFPDARETPFFFFHVFCRSWDDARFRLLVAAVTHLRSQVLPHVEDTVAFEGLQEGAVHGFHGDRLFSFVSASVVPAGPVADDDRPSGYLSIIAIFTLVALQDQTIRGARRGALREPKSGHLELAFRVVHQELLFHDLQVARPFRQL